MEKSKPTILIVDDVSSNLMLLSNLLKDDYNLKIAKDGVKAIEIMNKYHKEIDLILLDIIMPEMDGYEVCKRLKSQEETKNIPIIFVSTNDSLESEEYGLKIGAVDYIKKPYSPPIVKIRIKNIVGLKLKTDQLEELSLIDGLSQIPNRRHFDKDYLKRFKDISANDGSFAVLMIDIDYFKFYNDNYGHGMGDETIVKIAQSLQATLRDEDFVARYGGEEFVVILSNINLEYAEDVSERLLTSIRDLRITHKHSSIEDFVTISIGTHFKSKIAEEEKSKFLVMADQALYKAKENGRNQYYIFQ